MPNTDYAGIDYGMGQSNVDRATGIRYGVISAHELHGWFWEDVETVYDPHCPMCGNDETALVSMDELDEDDYDGDEFKHDCHEFGCPDCKVLFGESAYGDEPDYQYVDKDGYKAEVHSDGDVFLVKSPYYTRAQFCSPCAPGAGHLGNPCADGPKTYCFGHDWFDGEKAPYPVYRVEDDVEVTV
jgi:hypothetical protein